MSIEKWDPFDDLLALRDRMNELFERSIERTKQNFSAIELHQLSVDMWDTSEAYIIFADMPGIDMHDIEVTVTSDNLTVKGVRKRLHADEGTTFLRIERTYGNFSRRFVIPDPVDSEKIEASLKNGVLKIVVPKLKKDSTQVLVHSE